MLLAAFSDTVMTDTPQQPVTEFYSCAWCRTAVLTRWVDKGMLSDRNSVLVADWVFHASCWDLMLRENPP